MPGMLLAAGGDEADQVVDFSVVFDGDDTEYEVRKARGRRIARHEGRAMVPRRSKQDRLPFFLCVELLIKALDARFLARE